MKLTYQNVNFLIFIAAVSIVLFSFTSLDAEEPAVLYGEIREGGEGKLIGARLYVVDQGGKSYFAESASPDGKSVVWEMKRGEVYEGHTALSAHPFTVKLPAGNYEIRVERGKEFHSEIRHVLIEPGKNEISFFLRRWVNMNEKGWYSADLHSHSPLEQAKTQMLAENLNLIVPLSHFVKHSHMVPDEEHNEIKGEIPEAKVIELEPDRIIYPMNTEYEIFKIKGKKHRLGGVMFLGHQKPFALGLPTVKAAAAEAREQGAYIAMEKHSWEWTPMVVPVMGVDFMELANNHLWPAGFGAKTWALKQVPAYMDVERNKDGFTEWGWVDYGLQTYYAYLNCGFKISPSAGTGSNIHPNFMGCNRVYAYLDGSFNYDNMMSALKAGRSFITNGPMLTVRANGQLPGSRIAGAPDQVRLIRVKGSVASVGKAELLEIVVNGDVIRSVSLENKMTAFGSYQATINEMFILQGPSWFAVRVFEGERKNRVRFAHTAPFYYSVEGKRLRPKRKEVEGFITLLKGEIKRNKAILSKPELGEYREALAHYRKMLDRCVD